MWNLHYMDDALVLKIISNNNNMCYRLVDMFSKTPKLACNKYYNLRWRVKSTCSNSFKVLRFLWSGAFFQWKIENGKSLPSSSAEGWRSSLLRKTSWIPELRSRTTSAIHPYIHTSGITPHPNLLPQGARKKSLTSIHPYLHTSETRRCA